MVVIVIRTQPKDSEICSSRNYSAENSTRVFASSRMPETYDERDCFNESWPSSHDLVLNANLESSDFECLNGKQEPCSKIFEEIPWEAQKHFSVHTKSKAHTAEQKTNEFRLDSPSSKDSGYCDRITPHKTKKITYYKVSEPKRNYIRTTPVSSSTMYLTNDYRNNDNNSTAYFSCSSQVDPEDSIATTKEEEWVTKKKIELTTTKQIETRVKRQVVLEDGKVVEDSGPMVTTNTTEDTEKQEHSHTERRTLGDDDPEENWVSVANPSGCVKEVQEKTVKSREETEERMETENVQHLGDFSDEGYMTAIKSGSDDFRQALEVQNKKELVESGPKIIHQSLKTKKLIDTEDKTERSQIQPGGKLINETRTTRLHEEYGDCNISDDDNSSNSGSLYETYKKENSQRYRKTKEQDITEYLANGQKIGEKIHHQAETSEGERHGDFFDFNDMKSLPSKLKRMRLRSQNNKLALENSPDILSKKNSSYEQEEETRKAETSKWLEYHFGSESTKSSKGSVEDLDDIVPSTQNSFINVTMKSQPLMRNQKAKLFNPSSDTKIHSGKYGKNISSDNDSYITTTGRGGYFQGISQWSNNKEEKLESIDRSLSSPNSDYKERSFEPVRLASPRQRAHFNSTPLESFDQNDQNSTIGSPIGESTRRFTPISQTISDASISPKLKTMYGLRDNRNQSPLSFQSTSVDVNRPSPPLRKNRKENKNVEKFNEHPRESLHRSIGPSYEHEDTLDDLAYRSSTPKHEDITNYPLPTNKKLYQRTRFAADIPPPPAPQIKPTPVKQKNKISESWKKLVGKLRSSSQDRKNKKRSKSNDSRSPSPRENTYQNYNSLDNYGSMVDREEEEIEEHIAPSRGYNGNVRSKPVGKGDKSIQRYYLGEDPFSTSIYGREREYENDWGKKIRARRAESDTDGEIDYKSRTLGRFSKSTSRLLNPEIQKHDYSYDSRGVQTLPRKLREEKVINKAVSYKNSHEASRPIHTSTRTENLWKPNKIGASRRPSPYTGSMINVSIVNQPYPTSTTTDTKPMPLNGPAKPARTYRSNLSRSQSFNVQPDSRTFSSRDPYKSNPQLNNHNRLDETAAPLESPSIISNWSQSSKHINEDRFKPTDTKDKRQLFMKGLYDRAPELFKTLHGDNIDEVQHLKADRRPVTYSNSFRSTSTVNTNSSIDASNSYYNRLRKDNLHKLSRSPAFTETYYDDNVIKTVSRSESSGNDDYSETVRIKSKSDDPLNPSETDTVKTFTKKKIPLKNGLATETIESSETKTIQTTKGLKGGFDNNRSFYNRSPSGVIIKVRNSRT